MSSNLRVSIEASAVRRVPGRREHRRSEIPLAGRRHRRIPPRGTRRGTVGTLLAEHSGDDHPPAVAYQDHQQAGVVRAAAARHQLHHVQVVPAETAALRMLEATGVLGDHTTGVRYDLDGSGLTITVLDRSTATVLSRTRTDEIRGDLVDELVRDHHLDPHHVDEPTDPFSHYQRRRLSWTL
ncbi:hypothetical protein [Rhodococcus koreensis]|uniref:hypothetical protein n=1 Tax=Rhodococcus koreensis TaxID=99653 RepID=UPI0036DB9EF3